MLKFLRHRRIQNLGIQGKLPEPDRSLAPSALFKQWLQFAHEAGIALPESASLSTTGLDSQPASRMVLLKEHDQDEFVFYSNYNSRKAKEIEQTPKVAMLFHWTKLQRQIRIEGHASKTSESRSDDYFASRDRLSQLGAHASDQSEAIASRQELENQLAETSARYPDAVPRPKHWGGYSVAAHRYEFWQGRAGRIHDRIRYDKTPTEWRVTRLQP